VLITGTLTNVCCESSARDAMMRNFKTVMVHDANAALTDADHNNSLGALCQVFADVMSTDDAIARLTAGKAEAAE
jgi:ureidoacrylate peracid hydrolase